MTAIAVFAFTMALISFRRLRILPIGRPAGAMTGAVAMVVLGVLTPEQAYAAINHETLGLLLGMMVLGEYLREEGLFGKVQQGLAAVRSPRRLLLVTGIASALLSALLVNDTVCLLLAPFVALEARSRGLRSFPYLMALATCANVGSAFTLTGNPQNMLVATLSDMSYGRYLVVAAVPVTAALAANLWMLDLWYGRRLVRPPDDPPPPPPPEDDLLPVTAPPAQPGLPLSLLVLALAVAGFLAGLDLAFTALAAATAVMVLKRRETRGIFLRLDWPLLLFFSALFVVVEGFRTSGVTESLLSLQGDQGGAGALPRWGALTLAGSNLVSNVPWVLVAGDAAGRTGLDPELAWASLAVFSTLAGNLTLIGSVANLIVAERSGREDAFTFGRYLLFGLPSTLVLTVLAGALLSLLA
jgi:Na+/H+ antiporter NhaD/arsenite permease-like protein